MTSNGHTRHDVHARDAFGGPAVRRTPSAWRAELGGREVSLKALAMLFQSPPWLVTWARGDTALLTSPEFASLSDPSDAWDRAQTMVVRMNAAGVLKFGQFGPVSLKRLTRDDEQGQEQGYAKNWNKIRLPNGLVEAFVTYTPNRPTVVDDSANHGHPDRFPKVEQWIVDVHDPVIDTVCSQLVEHADDWRVLVFIYEIIEAEVGQGTKMEKLGWATNAEIRLFVDTANSPAAIGTAARHGHHKRQPPPKPMSLTDAQSLLRRIVSAWLQWKHKKMQGAC